MRTTRELMDFQVENACFDCFCNLRPAKVAARAAEDARAAQTC